MSLIMKQNLIMMNLMNNSLKRKKSVLIKMKPNSVCQSCAIRLLSPSVCLVGKNHLIHYQNNFIEIFYPYDNLFDILLVFVSFLQTYYNVYFFHILFFYFFPFQINFCIYFLLALLIFLYHLIFCSI